MSNLHPSIRSQLPTELPSLEGRTVGSVVRLAGVSGGSRRTMHLMSLGLRVGETVVVTHTRSRGVVLASAAGRVAVGAEMARHIRIEEVG